MQNVYLVKSYNGVEAASLDKKTAEDEAERLGVQDRNDLLRDLGSISLVQIKYCVESYWVVELPLLQ